MSCNYRCVNARYSTCRCSCGGANHGGGSVHIGTSSHRSRENTGNFLRSAGIGISTGLVVPAVSSIFPPVGLVYTTYNSINFGYTLYKHLKKEDTHGLLNDVSKYLSSEVVQKVSEPYATQIAEKLTSAVEVSGLVSDLSSKTGVGASIYSNMFEGTVKNALINGVGNLAQYAIGVAIGG